MKIVKGTDKGSQDLKCATKVSLTFVAHFYIRKSIIKGNKAGLLTLAKYLIDYAYDTGEIYGEEVHLYPNISDEYIMDPLSSSSCDVYIKKENK